MQAFTRSVFDLFAPKKRYLVPMFQRPYVWGLEKQWEPLWEDIRNKAQQHLDANEAVDPHFMGAIVINQLLTFGAQIPAHEVIDGQQRLTTFQLFLTAFRDLSKAFGDEDIGADLQTHTLNSGKKSLPEEEFKVWPTRADQTAFTRCLKAGSKAALETFYPTPKFGVHIHSCLSRVHTRCVVNRASLAGGGRAYLYRPALYRLTVFWHKISA